MPSPHASLRVHTNVFTQESTCLFMQGESKCIETCMPGLHASVGNPYLSEVTIATNLRNVVADRRERNRDWLAAYVAGEPDSQGRRPDPVSSPEAHDSVFSLAPYPAARKR